MAGSGSAGNGNAASTSLSAPAFFSRLRPSRRVLIAGAGGGFDIYAGLPLAVALSAQAVLRRDVKRGGSGSWLRTAGGG